MPKRDCAIPPVRWAFPALSSPLRGEPAAVGNNLPPQAVSSRGIHESAEEGGLTSRAFPEFLSSLVNHRPRSIQTNAWDGPLAPAPISASCSSSFVDRHGTAHPPVPWLWTVVKNACDIRLRMRFARAPGHWRAPRGGATSPPAGMTPSAANTYSARQMLPPPRRRPKATPMAHNRCAEIRRR